MDKANQQNVEKKLVKDKIRIWKIDKQMFPYKAHYFLNMGAMGALLPYYPSIGITRFGLGAGNFAFMYTVHQFLFIVSKPIIGYAVDYFNNLKEMIVALTIITGILSYVLLAIPSVTDNTFIGYKNDSQVQKDSAHIIFCKLCPISRQLQTITAYLPIPSKEFQEEIFCAQDNDVFENLSGYCGENSNFSDTHNIKLAVEIRTCYASKSKFKELRSNGENLLRNKSSIILIEFFHNWISSELVIVCPNSKKIFDFQSTNFTIYDIEACFQYPHDKIKSNNMKITKYSKISNRVICNETEISKMAVTSESNSFKSYQFWLFTFILLISRACSSAIFTLSDTACYESAHVTAADYGKQRAWGAVGWGLTAPFSGFLNDYTNDYWASMILMTFLCALDIWNLTKINLAKPQYSTTILKDVKTILTSGEFIAFEIGVFLNGMGFGILYFFLSWFIIDIGGNRLLIGLANSVQCFLGEMPFMVLSGWIIKKVGHFNVVTIALLAYAIRFLAYSLLKDPWMILPIECLEGITYATFYAAMTSYAKKKAKPGTEATTQSLVCSTYEGLGAGMGCLVGGACFDYFGGRTTFFYAGLCFLGASTINVTSTVLLHLKKCSAQDPKETLSDITA